VCRGSAGTWIVLVDLGLLLAAGLVFRGLVLT